MFTALQRLEPSPPTRWRCTPRSPRPDCATPGTSAPPPPSPAPRGWRATEQDPNRRLGVLNSERHSGIPRHGPLAPALRRTWLGALPEPWTFERAAGYTLTHVVFHLTDWGRTPEGVPPDLTGYLGTGCRPGSTPASRAGLGPGLRADGGRGESARAPDRALLREAWARLARAQHADGSLPEAGGTEDLPAPSGFRGLLTTPPSWPPSPPRSPPPASARRAPPRRRHPEHRHPYRRHPPRTRSTPR
ncbi:hypothetical protein AB7952_00860 [Streptomyces sp. PG2]